MSYKYEHNGKLKTLRVFKLKQMLIPDKKDWHLDEWPNEYKILGAQSELLQRMMAGRCEYCSKEKGYFEVHHVRKLADIKGKSRVEKLMIASRRKTLILCVECHDLLHAGKLSDLRFKRSVA